jgi:hypothetical protein
MSKYIFELGNYLIQDTCLLGCCTMLSDSVEPLKRRSLSTRLHGATAHKAAM